MAGGNVNDRQEAFLTRVTYTIAEYGVTIPGETDVDIGDVIDGQLPLRSSDRSNPHHIFIAPPDFQGDFLLFSLFGC